MCPSAAEKPTFRKADSYYVKAKCLRPETVLPAVLTSPQPWLITLLRWGLPISCQTEANDMTVLTLGLHTCVALFISLLLHFIFCGYIQQRCLSVKSCWKCFCVVFLSQAARARGVDCVVAPYEADAQLAFLTKSGLAQAVITEDSDLLAFGCKKVLDSGAAFPAAYTCKYVEETWWLYGDGWCYWCLVSVKKQHNQTLQCSDKSKQNL